MIMADANELPENSRGKSNVNAFSEESDSEDSVQPVFLDLGDDLSRVSDSNRLGFQSAGASGSTEPPKREDNPFSFKHFLRSDVNSYQSKGARPKVYCEGRPVSSVSDLEFAPTQETKQTRIVPEYSSALPDFVQDHLVIEQCYLNNSTNSNFNVNLPDFTRSRDSININRVNIDSSHNVNRGCDISNNLSIPLDLPMRPQAGFPLDLPISNSPQNGNRICVNSEVGVSKSLPDFLADGAVCPQNPDGPQVESPERECERLRRELEVCRGQLVERTRQVENLTRELEIARNKEHDYTQNLAKALEQVEKNLEKSNMRTASAENTIVKLRQEIKSLVSQLNSLKSENLALRGEEGAAGGHDYYTPNEMHSQRLAQELKAAASTAEHSLRQLLTGVDNLRIMAASLENMHRIEEKREPFLDLDEDTGPAL
ncbi:uncharacterized ENTR1 family protein [Tribolium madens]|uniref:uncharacterized ENTR1 family protein n=1 Tax=Tribolium madens TaxID=41895 RepID=UPI001CF74AD1|nr:uncharacterized ENTR1 family protein [Tribolium madens]